MIEPGSTDGKNSLDTLHFRKLFGFIDLGSVSVGTLKMTGFEPKHGERPTNLAGIANHY